MLTQRLHRAESAPRIAVPNDVASQRRAHQMVVIPSGRADRRRAHSLVCDSPFLDDQAVPGEVSAEPSAWTTVVDPSQPPMNAERISSSRRSAAVTGAGSLTARRSTRGLRSASRLGFAHSSAPAQTDPSSTVVGVLASPVAAGA
ncbi:MAG: hypothetical protein HOQ05_13130 [Corynebacteriales bacterium]|nr:hypothetical protein [Mycobacteriales bacterium]